MQDGSWQAGHLHVLILGLLTLNSGLTRVRWTHCDAPSLYVHSLPTPQTTWDSIIVAFSLQSATTRLPLLLQ